MPETVLFWFRRDLRLTDNVGLYQALKENNSVLPVFIFDENILNELPDKVDHRVTFIHESLANLKMELEKLGSSILIVHANPVAFFESVNPKAVYTNNDYEPYATKRDSKIAQSLEKRGIRFNSYKDHVIFEKNEIVKSDGSPYTVFTPYSKKWLALLSTDDYKEYSAGKNLENLAKTNPLPMPSLNEIGFSKGSVTFPARIINLSLIKQYDKQRDYPAIDCTSRLSVHLRFGTVSIRKLVSLALKTNEVWLRELIWREFYQMILWHFPNVENSFKPAYDFIEWRNDVSEFETWCKGQTGYPIVDAGMRELNATGFMHNRVRMIVSSFLIKHLLIDWRWGEAYFAAKLLDFDLASNNGGWQWAAGSGCDAAPYFRVFNPSIQTKKFDPELKYIKRWIPELNTDKYPLPMVDHTFARKRVLDIYKSALQTK